MKRFRLWMALALLILPSVVRAGWLYGSQYRRPSPVALPEYAGMSASLPVLATPEAYKPAGEAPGGVVLVDMAHENMFSVSEVEALSKALTGLGARLQVIQNSQPLGLALMHASAYVVVAPAEEFSQDEVQRVRYFARQGGRVLVLADPTRYTLAGDGLSAPNSLLAAFDLAFSNDYLYNMVENEGNYRNVLLKKFADSPLTVGLATVAFYAAHSVNTSTGTPLVLADQHTLSSLTDATGDLAAATLSADGQVLAVGDLTFITAPYYQVADNSRFIERLAEFLVSGERRHDLADAPFIFSRPVTILPTKNITLTSDLVKSLGQLQMTFKTANISSTLATDPADGSDLIVLGSYTPSGDLLSYLMPLMAEMNISLVSKTADPKSTFISIPGVGNVAKRGTGLILFSRREERTTLVLLANDPDALGELVNVLALGVQSGCIVQEQAALCKLSKSSSVSLPDLPIPAPSDISEEQVITP
jgi:hypothetical protein